MQIDPESVPPELREVPQWIVWRWVVREGKRTKPPFDPASDRPGDATDPRLWMRFDVAIGLLSRFDGIGFAVQGTPYCGVDLDRCLDEEGTLAPWAGAIVRRLDSYTELTPSERGLRVWVRGKLPPGGRRKGFVEMYDGGRYFTVTGRRFGDTPTAIRDRADVLAALHAEIFGARVEGRKGPRPGPPGPLDLSDEEVIRKAMGARNGGAFESLFRGDTSPYGGDDSRADLALCSRLAFWFGGDVDAIDRVFRKSGLYREKWERADYRERTIAKAVERDAFYDPAYRNGTATATGRNGIPAPGRNGAPPPPPGGDAVAAPPPPPPRPLEGTADPHRLARIFLELPPTHPDGHTLVYWNEEWHRWDGYAWRLTSDKEINAELNLFIKREFDRVALALGREAMRVSSKLVANVAGAMKGITLVKLKDCPLQPAWIGRREPGEDLPDPGEILPAADALIHLSSYVAGEPCRLALTPRFFSPTSLGYPFGPDGDEPAEWLGFLASLWPDDPESIDCLQEFMGYLLVPDTSQQKILMLIGPKRSGKGTIIRLIRSLIGPDNVTAPTLSGLATNFGMAPLIGKTVAMIADARLSGRSDSAVIVERLLSISGEDAQTIDRKHLTAWTGKLPTRIVLVSNELPKLGDSSASLPSRMILLRLVRSFYGMEDTTLTDRLLSERPAILRWAIAGWDRLRLRGRFTQPRTGADLLGDLHELASPIGAFVEERCETREDLSIEIKELYEEWKRYCAEKGRDHPGDVASFGRSLRAFLPAIDVVQVRDGKERVRKYKGIGLIGKF